MANIASVLKAEIARVARKEVRSEIESLRKTSVQHRSAIARLRREVAQLQKQLRAASRDVAAAGRAASADSAPDDPPRRFSAARLAAHRARLGLSAADYGQLVGMSGATLYLWEQGKSRPNAEQLQRLVAVRTLSRTAALAKLGR
jgi:DNA-binding transcriptional regulator YiaG